MEPATQPYKDRSGGLVAFGVMTLLLGVLAGLFVPLMFIGQAMAAKVNHTPTDFSLILPAIGIYGIMAVWSWPRSGPMPGGCFTG